MLRRPPTVLSAASLVLCLASAALWVRSLGHFEQVWVRYVRWPQPDERHALDVGFAWYANTLRLEVARDVRLPAHFRALRASEEWMSGYRASNPPGLHWRMDGAAETAEMNGYPPGFAARHYPDRRDPATPGDRWVLAVRPWLPTLAAAAPPAVWLYRCRRARRARRQGRCPACGYDLRATPEGGGALLDRCPECGAVQAAGVAA